MINPLTPYMTYIKIGAVALAVISLIGAGVWFRGVISERAELKVSEAQAKATTEMYAKAYNDNQKLQEGITNAVKSIRVVSNNYIQAVEDSPAPVGPVVTLISGGVPEAVSHLPLFTTYSSGRAGAPAEAR